MLHKYGWLSYHILSEAYKVICFGHYITITLGARVFHGRIVINFFERSDQTVLIKDYVLTLASTLIPVCPMPMNGYSDFLAGSYSIKILSWVICLPFKVNWIGTLPSLNCWNMTVQLMRSPLLAMAPTQKKKDRQLRCSYYSYETFIERIYSRDQ